MKKIGFVGLGIMGAPMAKNLIKAGYNLIVYDINPQTVWELESQGAIAAKNPAEAAHEVDVVITMLPDSPQVIQVVFGLDGILQSIPENSLFIDMSTIAPKVSENLYHQLKKKNVRALDAPVSGGYIGAEEGNLSIMVGGDPEAFERAFTIFNILGKNIVYMGEAGAGQVTKTCNQIIIGITLQAVFEAFSLAKAANVELSKVREALLGGFANSKVLGHQGERIITHNQKPGFKLKLHRKDLNSALETGRIKKMPLPCTSIVAQNMDAAIAQGFAESDHTAIVNAYNFENRWNNEESK